MLDTNQVLKTVTHLVGGTDTVIPTGSNVCVVDDVIAAALDLPSDVPVGYHVYVLATGSGAGVTVSVAGGSAVGPVLGKAGAAPQVQINAALYVCTDTDTWYALPAVASLTVSA